ncbi:MAG: VCBS repeat-containing protein [Bacteroidetes bacterium]|nr:VCBS repeat-containing protein [Bacteroidota bacterium]
MNNAIMTANARLLALVAMFMPVALAGQALDTLRTYTRGGGYFSYADRSLAMQAARFDLASPAYVHSVDIVLGGESSNGTAVLHLYGYEGGLPAPGLTRDLIPPITLRKSKPGIEHVAIRLRQPAYVASRQLFIAIDQLSSGVHLLSDRRPHRAACVNGDQVYSAQLLRSGTEWSWGTYSFLIDATVEYDRTRTDAGGLADVTHDVGLPDSLYSGRAIAWRDIDGDGFLDLLVGGRLFHNEQGMHFTEITSQAGLAGCSSLAFFLDADGDGDADIISIADEGNTARCTLYENNGTLTFTRKAPQPVSIAAVGCVSIADMNGDGAPDLFIGSSRPDSTGACTLLINDGRGGFTERPDLLGAGARNLPACFGSQWVDINGNGRYMLSVATGRDITLLKTSGDAVGAPAAHPSNSGDAAAVESHDGLLMNCHWYDVDNNGTMDLAGSKHMEIARARVATSGSVLIATEGINGTLQSVGGPDEFDEQQSAAVWGDIDNDGTPELLTATACDCHYASLYQQDKGGLRNRARDLGLWRVALGPDAIWVDFDNDGRVDLASFSGGRFRLLRNTVASAGHWAEVELEGKDAVGARVEVCAAGLRQTREVSSGRGRMMQEPPRLHVGLGAQQHIDSVVIRWSNGSVDSYRDLAADHLQRIVEGGASAPPAAGDVAAVAVLPNPARDRVEISVTADAPTTLSLGIYRLDGTLVKMLAEREHMAGQEVLTWNADDGQGHRVPQGTYVVRAVGPRTERSVKVMIVR